MLYKSPKISVITVTYNCEDTIEYTLLSLKQQLYKDYELIIVDGGSTDSTLKIIHEFDDIVNVMISEKDNGIYDAMNKGIKMSKGEFIFFLNAGDILYDNNVLVKVSESMDNGYDIIYGDAIFIKDNKKYYKSFTSKPDLKFFSVDTICHQSVFIRSSLFQEIGFFNTREVIMADYEFLLKAFLSNNNTFKHIDYYIIYYNLDGKSAQIGHFYIMLRRMLILKKYLGFIKSLRYIAFSILYKPVYTLKWKRTK